MHIPCLLRAQEQPLQILYQSFFFFPPQYCQVPVQMAKPQVHCAVVITVQISKYTCLSLSLYFLLKNRVHNMVAYRPDATLLPRNSVRTYIFIRFHVKVQH